jgi:hypothetical protein
MKTIRPIPKTPPLSQSSRRWLRGDPKKPSLTEDEEDSMGIETKVPEES